MVRIAQGLTTLEIVEWPTGTSGKAVTEAFEIVNGDEGAEGPIYAMTRVDDAAVTGSRRPALFQMNSEAGTPTVLGVEWGGATWIGCNSHVYLMTPWLEVRGCIDLGSLFSDFRLLTRLERLLVVAETGLFAFGADGNRIWRADFDIITELVWHDGFVVVKQMDGPEVTLDLINGHARDN